MAGVTNFSTSKTNTNGDQADNSGYGSSDETSTLLVRSYAASSGKPMLIRQECTTSLLISPVPTPLLGSPAAEIGGIGDSEESGTSIINLRIDDPNRRSVPDLELQCRTTAAIVTSSSGHGIRYSTPSVTSYLLPTTNIISNRCPCERRQSHSASLARSASRESVRQSQPPPTVLLTTSQNSRIIRQSSQPETTCPIHCCHHLHHHSSSTPGPSSSLRQLRDPADGIAGIAADSLRINGAIRQFKQVSELIIFLYSVFSFRL